MALPPPRLDSTVLVTGASAGIGVELARQLAQRGYGVTLVARRRERLETLAAELESSHGTSARVEAVDLADAEAREALIERLRAGSPEVVGVCNNAGFGSVGSVHELPREREVGMVRLNVEALTDLTAAFLPGMVRVGSGAVLNVASTAGFLPNPGTATYGATKAFVISFSEAVHTEVSGTGVSVTSLCPGPVHTEFGETAGMGQAQERFPEFVWQSAAQVAREGIDGMVAGRRSVVPGLGNKVGAVAGRFAPRSVLLPLSARFMGRLSSASELT